MKVYAVEWNWDSEDSCPDNWYNCSEHRTFAIFSTEKKAAEYVKTKLGEELQGFKDTYEENKDAPWMEGKSLEEYLDGVCGYTEAPSIWDILRFGANEFEYAGTVQGGTEWYAIEEFELDDGDGFN